MTTPASMGAYERLGALGQQLIPGIPDDITLDHIAPKIRWTNFSILPLVSRAWLHAIRSHLVYDARVRSHSTETLLVVKLIASDGFHKIGLVDREENAVRPISQCLRELPPISNLEGRFPRCSKIVLVDGKVFVLGGKVEPKNGHRSTDKVYVLDLAGRRHWKQCAGMKYSKMKFKCGLLDGKIYVFGGLSSDQPVAGSEVYDIVENTWSPIEPMISLQYEQRVETLGTELFEYDGKYLDREIFGVVRL